ALRQLEPPNPDEITKGLIPSRSTVEPEPTKSKYKGKSIGGISGLLNGLSTPTSDITNNIHQTTTPPLSNIITPTKPVSIKPTYNPSNELPKETHNQPPHNSLENSGIYSGDEITYSWMVLSVVCAFLIGFVGLLSV
ncbi:1091_t:CDS:1, partial [Dentiscutata heterogama]